MRQYCWCVLRIFVIKWVFNTCLNSIFHIHLENVLAHPCDFRQMNAENNTKFQQRYTINWWYLFAFSWHTAVRWLLLQLNGTQSISMECRFGWIWKRSKTPYAFNSFYFSSGVFFSLSFVLFPHRFHLLVFSRFAIAILAKVVWSWCFAAITIIFNLNIIQILYFQTILFAFFFYRKRLH